MIFFLGARIDDFYFIIKKKIVKVHVNKRFSFLRKLKEEKILKKYLQRKNVFIASFLKRLMTSYRGET
jgi:c-di-AMP phosphodiesterase-like protein